jgi:hypothetical protein
MSLNEKFRKNKMGMLHNGYDSHSDTFHDILITNLRCSFLFASLLILQSLNPKVNVAFILFVLHFLLLVGNIESNPGLDLDFEGLKVKQIGRNIVS